MQSLWVCAGSGLRPAPAHTHGDVPHTRRDHRYSGVKVGRRSGVKIPRRLTVQASTSDGRIVISADTPGQFHLAVPYTAFNAVAPGLYVHDCVLVAPDGAREVLFGGKMTVEASVTVPA